MAVPPLRPTSYPRAVPMEGSGSTFDTPHVLPNTVLQTGHRCTRESSPLACGEAGQGLGQLDASLTTASLACERVRGTTQIL